MSMSTDIVQPNVADVLRTDFECSASSMFVAFAILLVTIVYICPFETTWHVPLTYADPENAEHVEAGASGGSLARQIAMASLGLFGLVAAFANGGKRLRVSGILGFLCAAYICWCAISWLWADDIAMSFRRWVAFMCEVAAAVAIAKRVTMRQFVWIVFGCTLGWLGIGLLSEVSQGLFRPWESGYRFAGVFHPNSMGVSLAMLVLASLYLAAGSGQKRGLLLAVAVAGIAFLILTRSRTSLATMLVSLAVLRFYTAFPARKLLYTGLGIAAATLIFIAINSGAFTPSEDSVALGREDSQLLTLTERLPLWQELINDYAPDRPLLGYGYGAFWSPQHIAALDRSQGWAIPNAHSSYIDLVLNLGFIGAALCVAVMFLGTVTALRRETCSPNEGYGFAAVIVIFALIGGLTETYVGDTWFLSLFGICGLSYLLFDTAQQSWHAIPELESVEAASNQRSHVSQERDQED
jgi:O-antigen ligase